MTQMTRDPAGKQEKPPSSRWTKLSDLWFARVVRWVGVGGMVYGGISHDISVLYAFFGLWAAPWVVQGQGKDDDR
jgi:hypothetical protein